ncbi:hypothetical protein [Actinokineospora globicatena]|uniref:PPE family protein n=1 Tax=Actinokineospora globicatena TaxID=103729 RepID=A0A9W6VBL0_9PSEU|nr:hypothetical protein [Actinokineospora globicatena]GLW93078.1 hypothetical protein Aglo03_38940 [Actinokineospora globicatena]
MSELPGAQIYENFIGGRGPEGLRRAADLLAETAVEYRSLADDINHLTTLMSEAWQGDARDAALRGAEPLINGHRTAEPALNLAKDITLDQIALFTMAQGSVNPVPPAPTKPSAWDNLATLGAASQSYEAGLVQHRVANDANVHVMRVYEKQSTAHAAALPMSYGDPVVEPTSTAEPPQEKQVTPVTQRTRAVERPDTRRAQVVPTGVEAVWQQRQTTNPNVSTPPQQAVEPARHPVLQPPTQPGPTPTPTPTPGPPGLVVPPVRPPMRPPGGQWPPGGVGQWQRPGGQGGQGGQSGQGGQGERGQQGVARGAGGQAGARPGGGDAAARAGGLHGAEQGRAGVGRGLGAEGMRSGAGPVAEGGRGFGPEGTRGAGRAGANGLPMGGGGGGGARGEDDLERSAPGYLVVPDPEALFGSDAVTAPPVIGE